MPKKLVTNGISQVSTDNLKAENERLSAILDYVAMMTDIEIPTETETEAAENEQ